MYQVVSYKDGGSSGHNGLAFHGRHGAVGGARGLHVGSSQRILESSELLVLSSPKPVGLKILKQAGRMTQTWALD